MKLFFKNCVLGSCLVGLLDSQFFLNTFCKAQMGNSLIYGQSNFLITKDSLILIDLEVLTAPNVITSMPAATSAALQPPLIEG